MKFIIIAIFIVLPLMAECQVEVSEDSLKIEVFNQATKMLIAAQHEDFDEWVKYINPVLIDYPGGKQDLIDRFSSKLWWGKKGKPTIMAFEISAASGFVYDEESIQCTFPCLINFKYGKRKKKHKSIMIGVSRDNGKSWFFLDTLNESIHRLRYYYPFIHEDLKLK